jgi:hypothetical protein
MTTDRGAYFYTDNPESITAKADGSKLRMLLDAHLSADMPVDDIYYLHLLNIQMDVCELTGHQPVLKRRLVNPFAPRLSPKLRIKALLVNILGVSAMCKLNKTLHRWNSNR